MKLAKIDIMLILAFIVSFLSFRLESQTPDPALVIVIALLLAIYFRIFFSEFCQIFSYYSYFPTISFPDLRFKKKIKKTPGPALVIVTALRLLEVCQHQAALHYR